MADEGLNFKELQANISATLVETTRTVGEIAREDLAFHRSSDPSLGSILDKQASRLLNLAQGLLKIATLGTELPSPQLQDADSVEENWGGIVDVIDNLLEKTDACLDEYTGVIRKSNPFGDSQSAGGSKKQVPRKKQNRQEVEKPQNGFLKVPRNNETTPFKPLLRSKPHAILPLTQSLTPIVAEDGSERYDNAF
jgi:exosome complex exonuclease RRP6